MQAETEQAPMGAYGHDPNNLNIGYRDARRLGDGCDQGGIHQRSGVGGRHCVVEVEQEGDSKDLGIPADVPRKAKASHCARGSLGRVCICRALKAPGGHRPVVTGFANAVGGV